MDERPLVEGYIANFGISLDVFEFLRFVLFFLFFKKNWVFGYSWSTLLWYRCYRLNVFLPPLPEVGCQNFLEIRNPWGKVMVSHLNIFVWKWSKIAAQKKNCFFADFAVQNMLKTTLPGG